MIFESVVDAIAQPKYTFLVPFYLGSDRDEPFTRTATLRKTPLPPRLSLHMVDGKDALVSRLLDGILMGAFGCRQEKEGPRSGRSNQSLYVVGARGERSIDTEIRA